MPDLRANSLHRAAVPLPMSDIQAFCRTWGVREFALFGSILRDDFGPDSDVDILISLDSDEQLTLDNYTRMEVELRAMFNRPVDLTTRRSVERSPNWYRRQQILQTAETIHVGV